MSHKIDERKENIQKIKKDIENTQYNFDFTNGIIEDAPEAPEKQELEEKNDRRLESINSMIQDVNSRVSD